MYNGFKPALKEEQLNEIINEKSIKFVFNPEKEYELLAEGDKKALKHLVKAAIALDDVFLKQDHEKNIEMKATLEEAFKKGDNFAGKLLQLFSIFNGLEGNDGISKDPIKLFEGLELAKGKNVFSSDITKESLLEYLKENIEDTAAILNFDTVVKKDGADIVGIPYSIEFKKEYKNAAKELLLASKETTHKGLSNYLSLQAQALISCDPEYAYKADEAWAGLKDAPLEFTIGRESYEDTMTGAITEDIDFMKQVEQNGITIKAKDFIGARVGIVDIKASEELADYKNHLNAMSKMMPLRDQYKQSIELGETDNVKQVLVDVDLVYFSGDYAALRPGITLAQNLPNDDKLSVQLDTGNRNVFHKQVRSTFDPERRQKMLDALVEKEFHQYYDNEADHLFTIGHELTHSLGPMSTLSGKDKKVTLGDGYGDIVEEAKADLGSLVCLEYFEKAGKYSKELVEKILLTWAVDQLPLSEPTLTQAHRVREVMQLNYFIDKKAIKVEKGGKLSIDFKNILSVAKEMLTKVIQVQLDGDPVKAKAFVDKYRAWNDLLEYVSKEKKKLKPKPYKIIVHTLADKILKQ